MVTTTKIKITPSALRENLRRDGYVSIPDVVDDAMLDRLREVSDRLLDALPKEHLAEQRSTGSMIPTMSDAFFAELISYRPALAALENMGFSDIRHGSGYIISKPPHSPPLFWHQDWLCWDDPSSYTDQHQQLFLMYYLVDTTTANGCLRVIPGSHRRRHPVHALTEMAHTHEIRRIDDPNHAAYKSAEDEVAIPVQVGDLVVGDARILHASYANNSDRRRTVITMWHFPDYSTIPERIRGYMGNRYLLPPDWTAEARALAQPFMPDYEGDAEPIQKNRIPGPQLS